MANIENRPPGASAAVSTINHLQTAAAEMLQTWCQVWLHVWCPQSLENPDIQSNPGKLKFWPIRDTVFKLYDWSIHQISRESSFLNLALGGDRYHIQLFLIKYNPLRGNVQKKKSLFKDIIQIKVDHPPSYPIFDKLFFDKF